MSFLSALRRKPEEDLYEEEYIDDTYEDDRYAYEEEPRHQTWNPQPGVQPIRSYADMQIAVVAPKDYKESSKIADLLRDMKLVILNLSDTDSAVSRRLLDFISGVAYTEDGTVKQIATGVYIVAPYFVELTVGQGMNGSGAF